MRYLVRLLLVLIYPLAAFANFTGPVVSVLDGDTIEVLPNTHPERVRLRGTDCPETYSHFPALDLAPSFSPLLQYASSARPPCIPRFVPTVDRSWPTIRVSGY